MAEKKETTIRKKTAGKAVKGDQYSCGDCGLSVLVDEPCGCADFDVLCCGEPMKAKRSTTAKQPRSGECA